MTSRHSANTSATENRGEEDEESAKRFNEAEQAFAASGKVRSAAKSAKDALNTPESETDRLSQKATAMRYIAVLMASFVATSSQASASVWSGTASYYNLTGRTASGGHVGRLTAAHRSLPFGTKVVVTNLANRRFVLVTITDRGPFAGHRLIDVSRPAARALGFLGTGVARVKVETVR